MCTLDISFPEVVLKFKHQIEYHSVVQALDIKRNACENVINPSYSVLCYKFCKINGHKSQLKGFLLLTSPFAVSAISCKPATVFLEFNIFTTSKLL